MLKQKRSIFVYTVACFCLSSLLVNCAPTSGALRSPLNETEEVTDEPEPPNKPPPTIVRHLDQVLVSGLRVESISENSFLGFNEKRHSIVKADEKVKVVIFGANFSNIYQITFTGDRSCQDQRKYGEVDFTIMTGSRLAMEVLFPKLPENSVYNLCVSEKVNGQIQPLALIDDTFTVISTKTPSRKLLMPLYISAPVVITLLCLSGLFSGLNLGLMTLTPYELQLYIKSGTPREKGYAEKILPIRKQGNNLLCTLLLGNVVVNAAVSLLLDDLIGNGLGALFFSTAGIVVFGEIVPQAICVKQGLRVGAATIPLTRLIMFVMAPVSKTIAMILDRFLKEELTQPLGRKKLVEMMKMSQLVGANDCNEDDDFKIALGALEITDKTVKQAMTKIEDVFMLPTSLKLGPETVNEILEMGYTRIPIFENNRNNVVALLFVKDLALLDPDDNMDVMKVCSVYKHHVRVIDEDTPLRVLLDEFKKGEYHLAMVHRVVSVDDADPYYEMTGLITLEDIIEEIIQAEILDETDAVCDNVHRKKRARAKHHGLSELVKEPQIKSPISFQMQVVAIQWLTSHHPLFTSDYIDPYILEKLIRQNCVKIETAHLTCLRELGSAPPKPATLYTKGAFSDKFTLVLQGSAIVTIGEENMNLEAGAWHSLGTEVLDSIKRHLEAKEAHDSTSSLVAIKEVGFYPDYSAAVRHECTFISISAATWLKARRATLLTKQKGPEDSIVRVNSHSSLVDDLPSAQKSPKRNGKLEAKPRSVSESERTELLLNIHNNNIETTSFA